MQYDKLTSEEKYAVLTELYEKQNKSFRDIALELNTYANKIRRDAIKLKIKIKDKSEAQKNALKSGKHTHPTKGKPRDEKTKSKIGRGVLSSWDNLTNKELEQRREKARSNWDNLSDDEKEYMQRMATSAVRQSSKTGSKLEKYILEKLIKDGYKVQFHQEQTLANTKLQIDMVIPTINVAIEIDGPSHFLPVWGDEALKRNKAYDQKKEGLILGKGLALIRVKQLRDFSKSRADILYEELKSILSLIEKKFPDIDNRSFLIEDK
jgi:very-short-patch-repair endonuclease